MRRPPTPLFIVMSALVLTGCTATTEDAPSRSSGTSSPAPSASSPAPTPTPAPTAPQPLAAPGCDDLVAPAVVARLTEYGNVVTAGDFVVEGVPLTPGVECTWGIPESGADTVATYGWGLISPADTDHAIASLLGQGEWRTEPGDQGVYVTLVGAGLATDDEGYSDTYLFGDGWVMYSDVKAGIAEILRPGA